jgi:hypothetical protein
VKDNSTRSFTCRSRHEARLTSPPTLVKKRTCPPVPFVLSRCHQWRPTAAAGGGGRDASSFFASVAAGSCG